MDESIQRDSSSIEILEEHRTLFFCETTEVLSGLEKLTCHPNLSGAKANFIENINGAIQVGHIPFFLARSSVWHQRLNAISAAERIRMLRHVEFGQELTQSLKAEAEAKALQRLSEEWISPEGKSSSSAQLVEELVHAVGFPEYRDSAHELLRQLVVMIWNSFEILVSDVIRETLNYQPNRAKLLIADKNFKSYLSGSALMEALIGSEFDLSSGFGDFIVSAINFDSLSRMKCAASYICDVKELNALLKSKDLNRISAQRHLFVHRRGVVDRKYLESCESSDRIGEKLTPSADEVIKDIKIIVDIGEAVLVHFSSALET